MKKESATLKRLGDYIQEVDVRNRDLAVKLSQGICNQKYFQNPRQVSVTPQLDKIVRTGQFAYNRATTRNGNKISIAYREGVDCTVSSAYCVFYITDENIINPYYLWLWFKRPDFDRYAIFKSHGSAHEFFEFETLCNTYIPVPAIEEQRRIVARYQAIQNRIEINKQTISRLESAAQAIYRKMFVDDIDPENLPAGWRMGTLGEVVVETLGGDWGNDKIVGDYNTKVYCVRGTDIPNVIMGNISMPQRYIRKKNLLNRNLNLGDIVIEISGGGPTQSTGRVLLITKDLVEYVGDSMVCSNFCRTIKVLNKYSIFVYSTILMLYKVGFLFTLENSSNGVKNLDIDALLNSFSIAIPNEFILDNFNIKFNIINRQLFVLGKEIQKLTELQSLLLAKMVQ